MDRKYICSFCGRSSEEVDAMVTGPGVNICNECVRYAEEIIRSDLSRRSLKLVHPIPTPEDIMDELNAYVIGQDHAKKVISVSVYNHYKRIDAETEGDNVELDKSNILLVGPTGTGKTLLAQTLARMLQVPFAIADATTLTEAGYVGEDVENVLVRLLHSADYQVERAERGIVYVDEIDKVARKDESSSITRDVSGEGVQQGLLKLLEGSVVSVPPKGGRKHPEQSLIHINTKNILFICGGSFEGLEKIIASRVGKKVMGFGATVDRNQELTVSELLQQMEPDDLLHFGLIPELIGRLPISAALDELSEDALMKIMMEPKNSLVKQFQRLFEMDNVQLEFEESALRAIVREASKKRTGARALRSIMEESMLDIMYSLPSKSDVVKCIITRDVVTKKKMPIYEVGREETPHAKAS